MKTLKEIDDDDYAKRFNDAKEDFLAGYACCFSAAERAFQLFVEGYALHYYLFLALMALLLMSCDNRSIARRIKIQLLNMM